MIPEDIVTLALMLTTLFFILIAIELKNLIKSSIALAIGSALLASIFYILGAPIAAIFELSVCAGLVTVLLLSAIGMFENKEESK